MDYATVIDDAVRQFYSVGNNEAHSWLLQVQASPEAWQFVWQLLDSSKVPISQDCSLLFPLYFAKLLIYLPIIALQCFPTPGALQLKSRLFAPTFALES